MKKTLQRFWAKAWVKTVRVIGDPGGINTLELLMILGVSTIVLGGTYFMAKNVVIPWWNAKIVPQFPTQ